MRILYDRIEAAARMAGTILIVGESGTGKELVARAIHECGKSTPTPFIALNCAALPKDLIESELFGYKRGAFSGADGRLSGSVSRRGGRDALSGRNYRNEPRDPEQAAPRDPGKDGAAGRRLCAKFPSTCA